MEILPGVGSEWKRRACSSVMNGFFGGRGVSFLGVLDMGYVFREPGRTAVANDRERTKVLPVIKRGQRDV